MIMECGSCFFPESSGQEKPWIGIRKTTRGVFVVTVLVG